MAFMKQVEKGEEGVEENPHISTVWSSTKLVLPNFLKSYH